MKNEKKIWTNDEIVFLKNNYPKYGSEYCAKHLERNKKAIIKRANILKIKFLGTGFKYLKENLEPIVIKSKNIREVLDLMNLRTAGGNYKIINNYIKKYNIDISHFETAAERMKLIGNKNVKILLNEILVENSNYNRTHLKVRLYKEGLKINKCELCSQGEMWRGKKMSLILDHKNGIHNDNRIENLRIVCPNCNATLETHCGKHNKKKLKNKKLNNEKIKKIIIKKDNRKNPRLERRIINRPTLEQLKKEVLELGYSGTGRKYGVSDNSIRKWIKSYENYGI